MLKLQWITFSKVRISKAGHIQNAKAWKAKTRSVKSLLRREAVGHVSLYLNIPRLQSKNVIARRGNQRDFPSKGGRTTENGNENRQPRNKEDGEFRGGNRNQQPRNRREPGAKREGKKPHSNATENKEDGDDHWVNTFYANVIKLITIDF